jgi:hypothetical protein
VNTSDRFGGFRRLEPYRLSRSPASSTVKPSFAAWSCCSISVVERPQKARGLFIRSSKQLRLRLLPRGRLGNCPRYQECYFRRQPANEHCLDCTTDRWRAREAALDVAESGQGNKSGDCRYCECVAGAGENDVRTEDKSPAM